MDPILEFVRCCLARAGSGAGGRVAPAGQKCHLKTCGRGGTGEEARPGPPGGCFHGSAPSPRQSPPSPLPSATGRAPGTRRPHLHSTDEETEAQEGQARAEGRGAMGGGIGAPRQAPPSGRSNPPRPALERPGRRRAPASLRSARGLVQRGCVAGQGHTALGRGGPAPPGPPPGTLDGGPGGSPRSPGSPAAPGSIAPAGPEPGRAAAHRRRPSSLHPGAGSAPPPWNSDPARKGRGRALKGDVSFSSLRPRGGRGRPPDL